MTDTPLATIIVIAAAIFAASIGLMHLAAITVGGIYPGIIGMLIGLVVGGAIDFRRATKSEAQTND